MQGNNTSHACAHAGPHEQEGCPLRLRKSPLEVRAPYVPTGKLKPKARRTVAHHIPG